MTFFLPQKNQETKIEKQAVKKEGSGRGGQDSGRERREGGMVEDSHSDWIGGFFFFFSFSFLFLFFSFLFFFIILTKKKKKIENIQELMAVLSQKTQ